jgi:hypothetical protein
MDITPNDIRAKLLKERGITASAKAVNKRKRFVPAIEVQTIPKTAKMMYLEMKYGLHLEDVLISGSLNQIVARFGGEIDRSTVSKWIARFHARYTATNLPVCSGCKHMHPCCQHPTWQCNVLTVMGLYKLIPLKRKELQP